MPSFIVVKTVGSADEIKHAFTAVDENTGFAEGTKWINDNSQGQGQNFRTEKSELDHQTYYPRMARPRNGNTSFIGIEGAGPFYIRAENAQGAMPHDEVALSRSLNQLSLLVGELRDVFINIEPDSANMGCYSVRTRNILLLAAMEFENECKGIMSVNGYTPNISGRWSTVDFVKLYTPLRLNEYEVQLSFYPNISSRSPISGWNAAAATQSLPWYDAYNAVKHDRETNLARATVGAAVDAVIAVAIILAAEYRIIKNWRDQIGTFFHFVNHPDWPIERRYTALRNQGPVRSVNFRF